MRIERIGNATLFNADCREVLPALRFDALITDPVWPNCPRDYAIEGADDPEHLFRGMLGSLTHDPKRAVVVMRNDSDPRFLETVPWPFAQIMWLPYAVPNYLGRVLGGNEIAYGFGKHVKKQAGRHVIPSIAPKAQPRDRVQGHPMARALIHFDFLVSWWSDVGETVCDPFMGSGTTGVACMRLDDRPFIGCEIDPRFFDLACERIAAAHSRPTLFAEPSPHQLALEASDGANPGRGP